MAFYSGMNYGLPVNYQTPAVVQQPVMPPQVQNNVHGNTGIVWVQGEAGAKAYPVAAGTSMLLMDSEAENFYIKSTDASGKKMTEYYDLSGKAMGTKKDGKLYDENNKQVDKIATDKEMNREQDLKKAISALGANIGTRHTEKDARDNG